MWYQPFFKPHTQHFQLLCGNGSQPGWRAALPVTVHILDSGEQSWVTMLFPFDLGAVPDILGALLIWFDSISQ